MAEATVDFTWSEGEYYSVTRKLLLSNRHVRTGWYCVAVLLMFGAVLLVAGALWVGWYLLALAAIFGWMDGWLVWRQPKKAWKRSEGQHGPQHMVFSEQNVHYKNDVQESTWQWSLLPYAQEWPDFYVLGRRMAFPPSAGHVVMQLADDGVRNVAPTRAG